MIRHRGGAPSQEQESSSDDEDVFSALSLRTTRQQAPADAKHKDETLMSSPVSNTVGTATGTTAKHKASLPIISKTSSMKRHHGSSDSRKAKMEAVLQQLEVDTACSSNKRPFVPEKMGSFVQPGEEHLTTNIFVGNLAPSITEEQMTDLFRQFGDLYSLKIMWPRTPEEKARNRHTGFVCFMNRQDAEDAMEACDETDPFRVGRRIMMRWGKNVKKVSNATMTPFATKRTSNDAKRPRFDNEGTTTFLQESLGGSDAIQVVIPKDPKRARFITTIASFVAKDGSLLEQRFIAQEFQNPNFSFFRIANP
jgi:U2-associated protein SR140